MRNWEELGVTVTFCMRLSNGVILPEDSERKVICEEGKYVKNDEWWRRVK